MAALGHEPHQFTHFYVQVEDVAAALKEIEGLGGKTVVPPVPIPSGGFAGPAIRREMWWGCRSGLSARFTTMIAAPSGFFHYGTD